MNYKWLWYYPILYNHYTAIILYIALEWGSLRISSVELTAITAIITYIIHKIGLPPVLIHFFWDFPRKKTSSYGGSPTFMEAPRVVSSRRPVTVKHASPRSWSRGRADPGRPGSHCDDCDGITEWMFSQHFLYVFPELRGYVHGYFQGFFMGWFNDLASGKHTNNDGTSPCFMSKSTINVPFSIAMRLKKLCECFEGWSWLNVRDWAD